MRLILHQWAMSIILSLTLSGWKGLQACMNILWRMRGYRSRVTMWSFSPGYSLASITEESENDVTEARKEAIQTLETSQVTIFMA